jgi:hypothetical protein
MLVPRRLAAQEMLHTSARGFNSSMTVSVFAPVLSNACAAALPRALIASCTLGDAFPPRATCMLRIYYERAPESSSERVDPRPKLIAKRARSSRDTSGDPKNSICLASAEGLISESRVSD